MYVGVDIGGTKTLLAVLDEHGVIRERTKFPTPQNYDNWLLEVRHALANFEHREFKAGGAGVPVTVFDRKHHLEISFGNLPWRNVPIQADLERACRCPFAVDNDAKLGALSEYMLLKNEFERVLYVTVSTGIGIGLVVGGKIDDNIGDAGGRGILLEHGGRVMPWEDFASGHAIVERYHKRAADITSEATWRQISRDLAKGLIELIAITQPEVIVIGGAVGTYFDRYGSLLAAALKAYELPLVPLPELRGAERPEEAVVYGCYDLAKQTFPHSEHNRHAPAAR